MTVSNLTKSFLVAGALTLFTVPAALAAPASSGKAKFSKKAEFTRIADNRDIRNTHRSFSRRADGRRGDRHRGDRQRNNRFRNNRFRNRGYSYNRNYRPYRSVHYNRGYNNRYNNGYINGRGYRTPYRSNLGISFHLGTPGYSRYRWARNANAFYTPAYGSYKTYSGATTCRRVTREAYHHGHRELVSVKECSNPWSGTYIVQGSERVINCRY